GSRAAGAATLEAELRKAGATVEVVACDIADEEAVTSLLQRLESQGAKVRAVFHAAGVATQEPLSSLTPERMVEELRAKVVGAKLLLQRLANQELDAFVSFSSVAGTWGSGGQGAYAAANAFLDAQALHYRSIGVRVFSVAWGGWAGEGMLAQA